MALLYTKAVWALSAPNPGIKLVMLSLAEHANEAGYCWPSVQTLARTCGLSKRMIQRHLDALTRGGLVTRIARYGERGQCSNAYQFGRLGWRANGKLCFIGQFPDEPVTPVSSGGGTHVTPGMKSRSPQARHPVHRAYDTHVIQNLSDEPSKEPPDEVGRQQQQQQLREDEQLPRQMMPGEPAPSQSSSPSLSPPPSASIPADTPTPPARTQKASAKKIIPCPSPALDDIEVDRYLKHPDLMTSDEARKYGPYLDQFYDGRLTLDEAFPNRDPVDFNLSRLMPLVAQVTR